MGNPADTQMRLIEATRRIIIDEGVEATSIEHICKVAGFTRGAFYANFATKDSLLVALAEEEYELLVERLRARVDEWAARGSDAEGGAPLIENLLFEALDAIGVDKGLYVLHSELLMRSIRDPEWGLRLLHVNTLFVDELSRVLEWILTAAGRRVTVSPRAMTHAVIGIVMRAAGLAAWRSETRGAAARAGLAGVPADGGASEARPDSAEDAASARDGARSSAAADVLAVVLGVLHSCSEPLPGGEWADRTPDSPRH